MPSPIELEGADGEKVVVCSQEEILHLMTGIQDELHSYAARLDTENGLTDHDRSTAVVLVMFWNNNVPIIEGWHRQNEVEAASELKRAISEITQQDLRIRLT